NFQVFATGTNGLVQEKHQTNQLWRTWGQHAPALPLVGTTRPTIVSAPAAVAPRNAALAAYKDPIVVVVDNRGIMWSIKATLNTDDSIHWDTWKQLQTGTGTRNVTFTSAPSLWADSLGVVRAV